jgi:hypothetical protein
MNLEVLKKTKKKTIIGDIFVFKPIGLEYFFGRTISTEAKIGDFEAVIIYLYAIKSKEKNHIPSLYKSKLLLPPIATNYQAWLSGYFEVIENRELKQDEVFSPICLFNKFKNIYLNEKGEILQKKYEPVGLFALSGIEGIDLKIAQKLGIKAIS